MSIYNLTVASIESRTVNTKYGPKNTYTLIGTDGTKYSYPFTDPAKAGISVGTNVSAQGEVGKYGIQLDTKTVSIGGQGDGAPKATGTTNKPSASGSYSGGKVFPLPTTHGDTAIIRQNALTNAVATVADFIATQPTEKWPSLEDWTDMVITTAYKYAEFSSGQREVKAMRKLAGVVDAEDLNAAVKAHLEDESEAA